MPSCLTVAMCARYRHSRQPARNRTFCTNHRAPPGIESHLLEEIALANQWISKERLLQEAKTLAKTGYG